MPTRRTDGEIREQIDRLRRRIDVVTQGMYGDPHISRQMKFKLSEMRALMWTAVDELRWVLGETEDDAWGLVRETERENG